MRKPLLLFISFLLVATFARSQYILIDSNFAKFLVQRYPSCLIYQDPTVDPVINPGGYALDTTCSTIKSIDSLDLHGLGIVDLTGIQYFTSLTYLNLEYNSVTSSPALPASLQYLDISNFIALQDPFGFIPQLPNSLTYLNCSNGGMLAYDFPALPSSLTYLNCSNDGFYNLPALPDSLIYLDCSGETDNTLTSNPPSLGALPSSLPKSLTHLICGNNKLSALPALPAGLTYLDCSNMEYRDINDITAPSLFCLPKLPASLTYLSVPASITCLPNLVSGIVTSLPVCNPANNANICHVFPVISGNIFYDNNSNGIKDQSEFYKPSVRVQLSNGSDTKFTFTDNAGNYQISPDSIGSYTLSIDTVAYYKTVPATISYDFSTYDTTAAQQNIALQPIAAMDSLQISITPYNTATPGQEMAYFVSYSNVGTTTLTADVTINYNNNLLTYFAASDSTATDNGSSTVVKNVSLLPGQTNYLIVSFAVNNTDVPGNALITKSAITAASTGATDSTVAIITGAFDPNDKEATPSLTPTEVQAGKPINYTIHFQNTGNATALKVVIADTISSLLQLNSLQLIASSKPCTITVTGNVVYFEFPNISLPDSSADKSGSNGFVSFSIKPQSYVNSGSIDNTASIYFDLNSPVITNTASTLIQSSNTVVLVTLMTITATAQPGTSNILLNWSTASEINTKSFVIEESIDGANYYDIATVAAKGTGANTYSYSVPANAAIVYYRLKMIDNDGRYTFSAIVAIGNATNNATVIINNPVKNLLSIKTVATALISTNAQLINSEGALVKSFILRQGIQTIDVNGLAAGVYYLHTQLISLKVIINN